MNDNDLQKLLKSGRHFKLGKKQITQTTDDRDVVNYVVKGFIKRYSIMNDGSLSVQIVYGPKDVYPLTLVFKTLFNQKIYHGPEVFYYETMTEAEVYTINTPDLLKHASQNPKIYANLLQEAGKHLDSCVQRLENIGLKNSYKKVAHQLYYFAEIFGTKQGASAEIDLPLTHQDLADVLSLTRETVSTSMVQLRDKKLIKTEKNIIIPSLAKLQDEAFS